MMEWGQLSQWAMAAATLIGVSTTVLCTILGFLFREIRAVRAESNAGRAVIHARFNDLPEQVVSRREHDAAIDGFKRIIQGFETTIEQFSRTIQALSDQLDHLQSETADARIEILRHQAEFHGQTNPRRQRAAPTKRRSDFEA